MNANDIPELLAALQQALDAIEVEAGWQPDPLLARIMVRRRHSVRLLRRLLHSSDRPALGPRSPAAIVPGELELILAGEEHLAGLVDEWIADLPRTNPHRALADHLRAETDDAARALRLIIARRCEE